MVIKMMDRFENELHDLVESFQGVFDNRGVTMRVTLENLNKVVSIEDDRGTRIWIRLMPIGDKLSLDFSAVEFASELRRKGLFESLCGVVKDKDYIGEAVISNVCTNEMTCYVKKHNYEYNGCMNWYSVKERNKEE